MAEPTFIGRAYVFGLDGTIAYSGWAAMATTDNDPRALEYKDDVQRHDITDKKGTTVGILLFNGNPKITVHFYPSKAAGSGTIASAKTIVSLPTKGSKVTLAGFPPAVGTAEDFINSAKWIYLGGGSVAFKSDGVVEITLPLERFSDNATIADTANS